MLDPELTKILACPICRNAVDVREDEQKIICHHCQKYFPIEDDIPVMLASKAKNWKE